MSNEKLIKWKWSRNISFQSLTTVASLSPPIYPFFIMNSKKIYNQQHNYSLIIIKKVPIKSLIVSYNILFQIKCSVKIICVRNIKKNVSKFT